ncbi:MAG: hypothetical protein AB7S38_37375 [Vulcanimicrobiota bacterium]
MNDINWNDFFADYAAATMEGEPQDIARFYGPGFVAASPSGSYGALNDDSFLTWLKGIQQFNARTGMSHMRPVDTSEQAQVGPHHCLVLVRWGARFASLENEVFFEISYLLHRSQDGPRIIAYVSHEDQQTRMQEEGLL